MAACVMALLAPPALSQDVTLTPTPEGVSAHYRLTAPTGRFEFADPGVARSDWSPESEGTELDAAGVTLATPGAGFSILLRPDSTEEGRGYIALTRVGAGYVLYAPALKGAAQAPSLATTAPEGWVLTPADRADGYVYLGPASAIRRLPSGASAIAADDLPPALRDTVFGAFDDAVGFFSARFGPPPTPPILSATIQGAGPMSFRGDVTDTGLISARFSGASWTAPDAGAFEPVAAFAFHETAHLWNSHHARPTEGTPWLHEGGAEYMALIGAVTTGRMTEAKARESLSERLTACRRRVGARPSAAERMASGSAVYDCGVVVQWLADMDLRRVSRAPLSVFDVWKTLIDRADRTPEYGPADFLAALGPGAAAGLLFDAPAVSRWTEIEARRTGFGVRWENRPSDQNLVVATLSHLNGQACTAGGSTGFYIREGYVLLANEGACGPLTGEIPLKTIEGFDPLTAAPGAFAAAQARCAASEPVRLVRRDNDAVIEVPCGKPLAPPIAYAITEAPTLALN